MRAAIPLTGRELRHRATAKTMQQAQILLGRLLEQADAGRRPDSRVLVRDLLAQYLEVAELEPSTRDTYGSYLRRIVLPALGSVEVRKVRGPMLDTLYARLRRCSDIACVSGRPFTERNLFPVLSDAGGGRFQRWQRIASLLRDAIKSGELASGTELPSSRELATRYDLPVAAVRHAIDALAAEGLLQTRAGRPSIVAGELSEAPSAPAEPGRRKRRAQPAHDCARAGCRPHVCRPMSAATIRQIHSILSGAFAAAVRWEWIDRNPASSAKLPKARPRSPVSPGPADVAKAIATARKMELDHLGLYLWLAAVTGARRGELCGLQWIDVDLERGVLHVANSYLVRAGIKTRKDTKTHQDRYLALDKITVTMLADRWERVSDQLNTAGVELSHRFRLLQRPTRRRAVEPRLRNPQGGASRREGGRDAQHQGTAALLCEPVARGRNRPAEHCGAPWARRWRCNDIAALRRPGIRGGSSGRCLPGRTYLSRSDDAVA